MPSLNTLTMPAHQLLVDGKWHEWRVVLANEADRFIANNPQWKFLDKKDYNRHYIQTGVKKSAKTILIK